MTANVFPRIVLAILVTLIALRDSPAWAEQAPSSTVDAATRLVKWFSEFLKPFSEIGATAERQHFIDNLLDLNRDLFELEQDKRYVILALMRRPLNRAELERSSASLTVKIEHLRESLRKLAPQLRVAYRKGADEAIDLLSDALITRKAFVPTLAVTNPESANQQADEAQAAVNALSLAQKSLADAIDNLQKQ